MSRQVRDLIKTTVTSFCLQVTCQSTKQNTSAVKEEKKKGKYLCPRIYEEMKVYAKQQLDPDD